MLEYTLKDAQTLLKKNHDSAKKNLAQVHHDLDFLRSIFSFFVQKVTKLNRCYLTCRDQMTTTEVNMARLYNWDVKRRQAQNSK